MKYILSVVIVVVITSFYVLAADKSSNKNSGDEHCNVTRVVDGDTIHALCNGKDVKIRLAVIDSYESKKNQRAFKQAYEQHITLEEVIARGKRATEITKQELEGKKIKVVSSPTNKDRYGRALGSVYVDNVDINEKLLKEHPDVFLKY